MAEITIDGLVFESRDEIQTLSILLILIKNSASYVRPLDAKTQKEREKREAVLRAYENVIRMIEQAKNNRED